MKKLMMTIGFAAVLTLCSSIAANAQDYNRNGGFRQPKNEQHGRMVAGQGRFNRRGEMNRDDRRGDFRRDERSLDRFDRRGDRHDDGYFRGRGREERNDRGWR